MKAIELIFFKISTIDISHIYQSRIFPQIL